MSRFTWQASVAATKIPMFYDRTKACEGLAHGVSGTMRIYIEEGLGPSWDAFTLYLRGVENTGEYTVLQARDTIGFMTKGASYKTPYIFPTMERLIAHCMDTQYAITQAKEDYDACMRARNPTLGLGPRRPAGRPVPPPRGPPRGQIQERRPVGTLQPPPRGVSLDPQLSRPAASKGAPQDPRRAAGAPRPPPRGASLDPLMSRPLSNPRTSTGAHQDLRQHARSHHLTQDQGLLSRLPPAARGSYQGRPSGTGRIAMRRANLPTGPIYQDDDDDDDDEDDDGDDDDDVHRVEAKDVVQEDQEDYIYGYARAQPQLEASFSTLGIQGGGWEHQY